MKTFVILALIAVAISAFPIEEESDRENGVNGWYVPLEDGNFEWFSLEDAANALENIKSEINGRKDTNVVKYFLYTSENTDPEEIFDTKESIEASSFNPKVPTRFLIHGWVNNADSDWLVNVADAWLSTGEFNIIAVDWKKARTINYFSSVAYVDDVGKKVAAFMNFLNKNFDMSFDTLQCIGHSLGAHTCGYAAKNVDGKIHTIVGLDPALPLFNYDKPALRLNSEDAVYVESIQTNGGKLGFLQPIGKSAFYPNGGKSQPGCFLDITGSCSHGRSHAYYAAAIKLNNFPSVKCPKYKDAVKKKCGATYSSSRMCSASNFMLEGGQYYVPVSSKFPYGLGEN